MVFTANLMTMTTTFKPSLLNKAKGIPETWAGATISVEDTIAALTATVSQCAADSKFDSALAVCRKSRDCWLTLLGQAVYGPNRTPPSVYSVVIEQLAYAIKVVKAAKLSQEGASRKCVKMKYLTTIEEHRTLVKLLRDKGVEAVNRYLERRR